EKNSLGFSPLSRRATSQFSNLLMLRKFMNGMRAKARRNVVVTFCAQALTPNPLPNGEGAIRKGFGKSVRLGTSKEVMTASVYLETFGCQMNVADSERADVRLQAAGFEFSASPDTADVIIFNTCSVRERAAHKVFTRIGEVRRQRVGNEPVVGVMGCVAQLEGPAVFDATPMVSIVAGTRATDRLPQLISRALDGER